MRDSARGIRTQAATTARIALIGLVLPLVCMGACSFDPVKDLQRKAVGMRPKQLERCLPEAGSVEIQDDVERLSYAWTLDERGADEVVADLDSVTGDELRA